MRLIMAHERLSFRPSPDKRGWRLGIRGAVPVERAACAKAALPDKKGLRWNLSLFA
jgi:hypothetical protein